MDRLAYIVMLCFVCGRESSSQYESCMSKLFVRPVEYM